MELERIGRYLGALLCLLAAVLAHAQSGQVLIGVLEDNPGQFAGEPYYRDVRVVFYREGEQWKAFPSVCPDEEWHKTAASYPQQTDWTIAFDGRALGVVSSHAPETFYCLAYVGQQEIAGGNSPPTVGQRSREFSGWLDKPVYRPLIAVSQPNYRDPDGWKPAKLPPAVTQAVRREFRKRFPKVTNCTKDRSQNNRPWPYHDEDIGVPKAYASTRGWALVEVKLGPYRCDGPTDDPFQAQWFTVTPEQQVQFLASDMWLVDAGDYGGDGKSEVVFAIDGYDLGGYRLFYDDFRHSAEFAFSYH